MKPKIAFFDFASCEGCQLQVANLEETIIDVASVVDVVEFREVMTGKHDHYDIAFIEGSITRPIDEKRLKAIRKKSKTLVAIGTCAHLGGVQRLSNQWSVKENLKEVYPNAKAKDMSKNKYFEQPRHKAVGEVVDVDYVIPGCPIDRDEFIRVLVALVHGKKPPIPDYPVCVECKKKENVCLFTIGRFCMGPVAKAGCGAICPSHGSECEACRGYVSYPHKRAQTDVLKEYGLSAEEIMNRKTMFTSRYIEEEEEESS